MPHSSSSCTSIKTIKAGPFTALEEVWRSLGWLDSDSYLVEIHKTQTGELWLLLRPTSAKLRQAGASASRTKGSNGKDGRATSMRRKS